MDDKIKAFLSGNGVNPDRYGMDLRDYFANTAMHEVMRAWADNGDPMAWEGAESKFRIASIAYSFADAMIKARNA